MTKPTPEQNNAQSANNIDQAVAQGGAYEVLRKRLTSLGQRIQTIADDLNTRRTLEFGSSKIELLGRARIRTENNAVGRDIVQVGEYLLFGFNVFLGLTAQTRLDDVFGLYKLVETAEGYDIQPVDMTGTFLADPAFVRDFEELYAYYKHARLLQLVIRNDKLLAAFQIGERLSDRRVFRWALNNKGKIDYIDARGERDLALPAPFDFEWQKAGREQEVSGRFPHLNILDTLFVNTGGGNLTIKVENNTETGQGIYSEPVEEATQSIDDAKFEFARVGSLILLKVLPYREEEWRGLVYNSITGKVTRLDAIVQACVQLPEDHGIIFPGGYYLQNGEHKAFEDTMQGMQFKRAIRSPNGEDVLYLFYEQENGLAALFVYNMVQRQLQTPIFAHGYANLPDGRMALFHAEDNEPTRVHQLQVWQTPFTSDEYAASRPPSTTPLGRLGNAELVRGVSNLYDLAREIDHPDVSAQRYGLLVQQTRRLFDAHHWFDDDLCKGLSTLLHEVTETGESVLDEYEKVQSIRAQSDAAMKEARSEHRKLLGQLNPNAWSRIQDFVDALNEITRQRGHLLTIREYRYIDTTAIDEMAEELQEAHAEIGAATSDFLASDSALAPLNEQLQTLETKAEQAETAKELTQQLDGLHAMAGDLDMLSELMTTLSTDDATQRTRVVEAISGIYARLNGARARAEQRKKSLSSGEAVAQFAAQFSLFGQSITSALGLATTPERADEQLARLMVQLEELEGQFGEHEQFLADILDKREEMLEVFESHKQSLLEERQRKATAVQDAANRILSGLNKRTARFEEPNQLNAFFASDPLILKLRELTERLRELKDAVKADDVEARLKSIRDQAVRGLRDRSELFEDGGNTIRMGPRHRFSVNTQTLDLTLLPRGDHLAVHLTGTNFMQPLDHPELNELKDFWPVTLDSESPEVYRSEYLAGQILNAAEQGQEELDLDTLYQKATNLEDLTYKVRSFAAPRYREGYEKGIHDHDAALILQQLLPLKKAAGPLIYSPTARALAVMYWANHTAEQDRWKARFQNAHAMRELFASADALNDGLDALALEIEQFLQDESVSCPPEQVAEAARYLAAELETGDTKLSFTRYASELLEALDAKLRHSSIELQDDAELSNRWTLLIHWLNALCSTPEFTERARYVPEAAALKLFGHQVRHEVRDIKLMAKIEGLLGEHPRVENGQMTLALDETLARLKQHRESFVPAFHRYQDTRAEVIARQREQLRLSEYQAKPLTSFVRNRLINDIYLPIIGDNLAKQIGTVGESKRSDLMGLLMLISPPGYGKTTLMEYVAHRLGLVFMKINGPSLGHEVRSLDPSQAPDATSAQELEKLNLALEMGNNVMLYVDDIQHTHPEFLQKFISLTDGTRRIEGVWEGRTKTYDLRGRKFAVVMAGNPYTESGEVFKIPDMLANRADIYNLGDVLGGMEDSFLLSYIENSLTSNPVLAPLATRDMSDLYLLVDKAEGKEISTNALKHNYGAAEVNEIVGTLQKLLQARDVLYSVNSQYIASAAQDNQYRTEPPFKLQGSYRNMNKLAEKISPVMNEQELQQVISDHYLGESQLLTTGAEENLLKLGELRGTLSPEETKRWEQIKSDFKRNKAMGGDDTDTGQRVVAQLADIARHLESLGLSGPTENEEQPASEALADALSSSLGPMLADISSGVKTLGKAKKASSVSTKLKSWQVWPPPPQAQQATNDLPNALKNIIAPLLAGMAASNQKQDQVNNAIYELVEVIRKRQGKGYIRATRKDQEIGRHQE